VGNEIPVITSNSQSLQDSNSPVLQSIQYRATGVVMSVTPTVHSSGYVDIEVTQSLSEAQQNSTSSIDSPTIFKRELETTVTLRDGASVLLGGLISQTKSRGQNGIPGLGKIPLLGKLFKTESDFLNRTELMVMVIPYILEDADEASEITDKAVKKMELLRL
jgi:general secretion pathway protein D